MNGRLSVKNKASKIEDAIAALTMVKITMPVGNGATVPLAFSALNFGTMEKPLQGAMLEGAKTQINLKQAIPGGGTMLLAVETPAQIRKQMQVNAEKLLELIPQG